MHSPSLLLLVVLALASRGVAQLFLDDNADAVQEMACLAKLNWAICFRIEFRDVTLEEDPGFARMEALTCTPECKELKASYSPEYVAKKCGLSTNPYPRWIRPKDMERRRIEAQQSCSKDDDDKQLCQATMIELYEATKFNIFEHIGPNGTQPAPWSAFPKDIACSKCTSEHIQLGKQLVEWSVKNENSTSVPRLMYDDSEKGMQERTEMCKGWKPPPAAAKSSPSPPTVASPTPTRMPSSAPSAQALDRTWIMLVMGIAAMMIVGL